MGCLQPGRTGWAIRYNGICPSASESRECFVEKKRLKKNAELRDRRGIVLEMARFAQDSCASRQTPTDLIRVGLNFLLTGAGKSS
jgi:hypothetical protein